MLKETEETIGFVVNTFITGGISTGGGGGGQDPWLCLCLSTALVLHLPFGIKRLE